MPYHLLVADGKKTAPLLDQYLGSALTLEIYWESVGRKRSLPIIASITERADSQEGFVLEADELQAFRRELVELRQYWQPGDDRYAPPETLLQTIGNIEDALTGAAPGGLTVYIG